MAEKHEDPYMYRSVLRKKVLTKMQKWREAVGTEEPTPERRGEIETLEWINKSSDLRIKDEEWA